MKKRIAAEMWWISADLVRCTLARLCKGSSDTEQWLQVAGVGVDQIRGRG